jgi:hypothetical protein
MKVEFLSDAINKPLGLMVIVLVGIFIIKMRGKIQTYGINNNRSSGNINIRNNGNNRQGNNRQGNNGNNGNNGRRRIGNIGRTALAIGDFYIAIQFGLFVFFLSLLIFILSAMEKGSKETKNTPTKSTPTKSTPTKSASPPPYFDFSEDQRRKGDLAFWSVGLLMGAAMTGAGKAKYFWPPWLVIAIQDFLRFAIIGRRMSAVGTPTQGENILNATFLIINIALMGAVVHYHSWSTLGKGGIIFLTSTFIAAMVSAVVMTISEQTGTKKAIKQTPKKWVTVKRDAPPLNTPSGTSTRTWPSHDGKGGKA